MNIHTQFLYEPIQLIKNTSVTASSLDSGNNTEAIIRMKLGGSIWLQE